MSLVKEEFVRGRPLVYVLQVSNVVPAGHPAVFDNCVVQCAAAFKVEMSVGARFWVLNCY